MYYVYKIENSINNKKYIGITNNPSRRKQQHWYPSEKFNIHLAMEKYGKDNFTFSIIESNLTKEEALELEAFYVEVYDSYNNGYNMTPGGDFNPSLLQEVVDKRTEKLLNDPIVNQKLRHIGEKNPRANYTEEDVMEIRKRRMNGERGSDVYEDYKHIDNNAGWRAGFSKIWLHDSWEYILPEYKGKYPEVSTSQYSLRKRNNLTDTELEEIKKDVSSGQKYNTFFKKYKSKVDWNTFQAICKTFK